jgi:hypothetical protein
MTRPLEVCMGELQPKDKYCLDCINYSRQSIRERYCYIPCTVKDVKMPLPLSDEELETEAFANYRMVIEK